MQKAYAGPSVWGRSGLERPGVEGDTPVGSGLKGLRLLPSTWPWQWLGKMGESSLQG